jgi:hypothetical protein
MQASLNELQAMLEPDAESVSWARFALASFTVVGLIADWLGFKVLCPARLDQGKRPSNRYDKSFLRVLWTRAAASFLWMR